MQALPNDESSTYAFSPRELERLAIYRAAINAGFFTDRCEPLALVPVPHESVRREADLSAAA
ncbi:MAG: hypothetical protein JOZ81_27475 [Chloroflexi bacterium]|nr:hypothetical protein [Chloroflexota bacterium]MBV9546547.1 hypothetical protein [Chloroflexota bacterium]